MSSLKGKVAVVAGATRGAGRGIACMLGEAGATVYCTGRSVRGAIATEGRTETIEETAEMVTARGGRGVHARVDHTVPEEVEALFERVRGEEGRLDVLVNDVWGGDRLTEWGKPFWEQSLDKGLGMIRQALHSHIITSRFGIPLMVEKGSGLVVEIGDGAFYGYRASFYYDFVKTSVIRIAFTLGREVQGHGLTAVAVTPGFLRSEAMLDYFGVTEETWRDAAKTDPDFLASETPFFVGRAIAALAADPNVKQKNGRAFSSWALAREYGFTDVNGETPDWGRHFLEKYGAEIDRCDDEFYRHWEWSPLDAVMGKRD